MSMPSALFAVMINHLWQGLLIAAVLAGLLAARRVLAADTRHALAFAGLVAAAALPLAMLLPANDALMSQVAQSIPRPAPTTESAPAASEIVSLAEPAAPAEPRPIVELSEALFALRDAPEDDRGREAVAAVNAAARTVAAWTDRAAVPTAAAVSETPAPRPAVATRREIAPVERAAELRAPETAFRIDASALQPALDAIRHPAALWALAAIWLAGALVLLVRLVLDVRAAEGLRRRATRVELPRPLAHLIGALDIRESDEAAGPMALGLLRTAVILPRGFVAERSPQELLGLIEHERAHVARGDVRFALAQRVLTALLWWSPAIHWISARVDEEREMACDEAAAARVGDARAFARTLTEHAQTQLFWGWPRLAVGAARGRSLLGRRVRRLIEIAGGGVQRVRLASRACAGMLLAVVAAAAIATPRLDAQDAEEDPRPAPRAAAPAPRAAPAPEAPRAPRAPAEAAEAERAVDEAEEAIDDAAERFGEAVETLYERSTTAEDRAAAREEMNAARQEMQAAGRELQRAIARLVEQELALEFGQGHGAVAEVAEIERMVEEISNAASRWTDSFDFDFNYDFDPEAFARMENLADVPPGGVTVYAGWGGQGRQSNPLMTAVGMGDLEMVDTLIEAGADVNASVRGSSPLTLAAANGETDIVRSLLEAGANANGPEGARRTPLGIAAQNGEQEILELLIEAGADIDEPLPGGDTLLMAAVRSGDVDMVRMLIERGADVEGAPSAKAVE